MPIEEAVAGLLSTLTKGQYLLLVEAIRRLGGELRIDPEAFEAAAGLPSPRMAIDASDGPLVLRLQD